MADYILSFEYKGQRPDFKVLTLIKHPLQAILRRHFPASVGYGVTVKIAEDCGSFIIRDFYRSPDELEKPIETCNRANSKRGPALASHICLNYSTLQAINTQLIPRTVPETDETLRVEKETLEEILAVEQNVHEESESVLKEYAHRLEGQVKGLELDVNHARQSATDERSKYNRQIDTLQQGVDALQLEIRRLSGELEKALDETRSLQESNAGLSKTISDLASLHSDDPLEVMYRVLDKAASGLAKYDKLEELLHELGTEGIKKCLEVGSQPFYAYINERFGSSLSSDADIPADILLFEQTEYWQVNHEKYEALSAAFAAINGLRGVGTLLADVVDLDKLTAKETELTAFRAEFEQKKLDQASQTTLADFASSLREQYGRVRSLAEYCSRELAQPVSIPVLIREDCDGGSQIIFPSGYVSRQIAELALTRTDESISESSGQDARIAVKTSKSVLEVMEFLETTQSQKGILQLGFKLAPRIVI